VENEGKEEKGCFVEPGGSSHNKIFQSYDFRGSRGCLIMAGKKTTRCVRLKLKGEGDAEGEWGARSRPKGSRSQKEERNTSISVNAKISERITHGGSRATQKGGGGETSESGKGENHRPPYINYENERGTAKKAVRGKFAGSPRGGKLPTGVQGSRSWEGEAGWESPRH